MDPTKSASATVTLSISSFPTLRVNAGGPTYTDPEGRTWIADQAFTGNWSCGAASSAFSITPPAGSTLPVIYQTGHICDPYWGGTFTFHAAVLNQAALPNMDYVVTLKFADPTATATGQRVFNVVINGQTVLPNLDVFAKATGQYPRWDATIPVTVTNGNLDIAFNSVAGAPIVNAIEIAPANSVEVIPHAPALGERQNVQFSAIVQGAPTASVLWSINPPTLGNITSTGVYTAPTSIPADTSVTVIATNAANPNQVGSTIVSLTHFDATSFTPLRVNAGGPAYTDPEGRTWVADQAFTGNWSCGSPSSAFSITPPAGSTLPVIYQTGHICDPYWGGTFTFHAAVLNQAALPNMEYFVTLKFADPTATAAGQRVFNVVINGQMVLPNLDVFAKATGQYPRWDVTIPVTVTNGNLDIAFNSVVGAPIVNAIEIVSAGQMYLFPQRQLRGRATPCNSLPCPPISPIRRSPGR